MQMGVAAIEIPAGVVNDLAAYWQTEGFAVDALNVSRADLRVITRRCLEAYIDAIMVEGIKPLDISDPMMWGTHNEQLRQAMLGTGYSADWTDEFLYNLWGGVQEGKIDPLWLTPLTVLEAESPRGPSYLDKLAEMLQPGSIVEGVTGQMNRTLLLVGAGALIFLLGREVIRRKL